MLGAAALGGLQTPSAHAGGAAGTITEIALRPGAAPRELVMGATGNAVQFPESGLGTLGAVSEKNRYSRNYLPLVTGQPTGVAVGTGGYLWITETKAGAVERWAAGKTRVFHLAPRSQPRGIAAGTGAVWFCEGGTNRIGRLTPAGSLTEYPIPTPHSSPSRITVGPDGKIWFTEQAVDRVGRLNPATRQITTFRLAPGSRPFGITTGPDGNMWVTETGSGPNGAPGVAVLEPATGEVLAHYPVAAHPLDITTGTDGLVWLTDPGTNSIVSVTATGTATAYPVPTPHSGLMGIATGPRGQIWFTQQNASRVGRIDNALQQHTQYISIGASVIEPAPPKLQVGSSVQWTFFGPGVQSATDATGMGLYDSGPRSFVSTFTHTFTAAGTYPFGSTTSALAGVVKVLPQVAPAATTVSSPITVTWATGPAPAGFHYEVQVRQPGHSNFTPWLSNTAQPSATFTPAQAGSYAFEARLVDTATVPQTSSGWSSPVPASVS